MSLPDAILSHEFIRAFAWTLLHSLWQGALVASMAAGFLVLFRSYRPPVRYTVLYSLLALLPVLFVLTFLWCYNPHSTGDHVKTVMVTHQPDDPALKYTSSPDDYSFLSTAWYNAPARFVENHANWLVLIWFAGFLFFFIRFSGSILLIHRLRSEKIYPVDIYWHDRLKNLSGSMGLRKSIKFAESAIAKIPMTIGYLKPVILVPLGTIGGVPAQQLDAILLHELAHILRRDYLLNIIQSVIEMIFFYHPVTWWISGLIRQEREHICDDLVISVNHDHLNYIKALTTMEELNVKTPMMANAITGSRKKLLNRVKRLLMPAKIKRNISEGIVAFFLLATLVLALSFNALSIIPDSYDMSGRESGERLISLLPNSLTISATASNTPQQLAGMQSNTSVPDTIISTSKSGKVIVKVYTDTIGDSDQKHLDVFVEALDHQMNDLEKQQKEFEKQVIILKSAEDQIDSISKIIVIKSGDSIKVINQDTVIMLPEGYDTVFSSDGGIQFYGFDVPEIPEFPEFGEMPDMKYYYFDDDQVDAAREFERAVREQERKMNEFQRDQEIRERELDGNIIIKDNPRDLGQEWKWQQRYPELEMKQSERIIRQELNDDGLISGWKKYVIEINSKAMYINGEKQPKETFKKYRKLVESLEQVSFENGEAYKLIF